MDSKNILIFVFGLIYASLQTKEMNRLFWIFTIAVSCITVVKAQSDNAFVNIVEQTEFNKLIHVQSYDTLLLWLNVGTTSIISKNAAEAKLNSFVKTFAKKSAKQKSASKYFASLHTEVHKVFLREYALESNFHEIFNSGKYNCLTASALYGMILQKLGIRFSFMEMPGHVFVKAQKGGEEFALETTNPFKGTDNFTQALKRQYLDRFAPAEKFNSIEEINQKFNNLFYKADGMDFKHLLAAAYNNNGIYLLTKDKLEESVNELEKSKHLAPTDRNKFLLSSAYYSLLNSDYANPSKFVLRAKALIRHPEAVSADQIENKLSYFFNKILIENGDIEGYESLESELPQLRTRDTLLAQNVDLIYQQELGRYYAMQSDHIAALAQWEKCYKLRPNNLNIKASAQLELKKWALEMMEEEKAKTFDFDSYLHYLFGFEKFNLLDDYSMQKLGILATCAKLGFLNDAKSKDAVKINKYWEDFLKIYDKEDNRKKLGEEGYECGADRAYYLFLRIQDYKTTNAVINKVLELYPENETFLQHKKQFDQFYKALIK